MTQQKTRKEVCRMDTGRFGREYLSHYFLSKSPEFHTQLNKIWQDRIIKTRDFSKALFTKGKRVVIAAPRGHAKSTVTSFQNALHAALYGYKKYIILISDTESQAVSFLDSIKSELEDNESITEDFGVMRGKIWKSTSITLANGCRIDALGSGQKLRGRRNFERRPDLIIMDDIENDEEVRSPEGRRKLASWYFSAVSKAGDYYTDLVFIGTVLHRDSLLARLLKNPSYLARCYRAVERYSASGLWDKWEKLYCDLGNESREDMALAYFEKHKKSMLKGTQVLWQEKLPYYDLMVMRISEGEGAFNTEMQNNPIDRSTCLFPKEWTSFYNPFEVDFATGDYEFFGYCDPSLGRDSRSDYSAIITIARCRKSGVLYVESGDVERRHPDVIIENILETARRIGRDYKKRYTVFGAETNQFQWFLKEQLAQRSREQGVYLPVTGVRASGDKVLRIQTLQPYVKNGYVKFNPNQHLLLEQLWDFPFGAHDDGPDALEGCISLCRNSMAQPVSGLTI